jgi:hypothetical protein
MKYKFGSKVKVAKAEAGSWESLYTGAQGVVIDYDKTDLKYAVLLNYNQVRHFYESNLVRIKRITK